MRTATSAVAFLVVLLLALALPAGCSCSNCPIHRMLFGSKNEQVSGPTSAASASSVELAQSPPGNLPPTEDAPQ
jgi:hypothetical protein